LSKINIIGAGGHTRSLIPVIRHSNLEIDGIYDDGFKADIQEVIEGISVKGMLEVAFKSDASFVISIGDISIRKKIYESYKRAIYQPNLIGEQVLIRKSAQLGRSNQIMPFVFINSMAKIGNNNIINSKALIEHESVIGDHCHVAVGAVISGRVTIGNCCFIGAGAIVKDKIKICDDVIIGAGAVVVNNITEPGTYVGNPLRKIK